MEKQRSREAKKQKIRSKEGKEAGKSRKSREAGKHGNIYLEKNGPPWHSIHVCARVSVCEKKGLGD